MALWTPANLATAAKCWLKADSLALANADPVVTWTDSSGSGANATVPGGAASPTFRTNQLNSLAIVRFVAASSQLMSATPSATTTFSLFAVARNNGSAQQRIISGDATGGANWLLGWHNTHQEVYYFNGGDLTGVAVTTNWLMYEAVWDQAGTVGRVYRDGTLLFTDTNNFGGLGSNLNLGGTAYGLSELSDCEVAEVLVCDYVMSTTDRQLVEGYLDWKWGRQASLPGGHPYAGAAPTTGSAQQRMALTGVGA